ncbi:HAD family hydrolase [Halobaculum limi]|uniref:HAD family hydrolase n=1 Tax=Halobaculum limi TaxID=3031916 RepID=UPI002405A006|nr:HAD family hydrolase [Halobaculum sp. YSMS11]
MSTAIWFDLDGTLLRFPDYDDVIARTCDAVGIDAAAAFGDAYNDAFFERLEALDSAPYRRAAETALAAVDADADPEAFVTALRETEYDAMPAPAPVCETLAALAGADGYRVGVCTNGVGDWQREKLAHAGLSTHVDATVVSYDVGAHKPDPAPFERAEAALAADRRVMIGDNEEADVAGARDRGWEAVHAEGPESVPDAVASVR